MAAVYLQFIVNLVDYCTTLPNLIRRGLADGVPAIVWRQALRVAIAVMVSYALGACFDVSFFEPVEHCGARADRYDALTELLRTGIKGNNAGPDKGNDSGSDAKAATGSLDVGGQDYLSQAVHNLVLAIQDYTAEAHRMSESADQRT